MNLPLLSGEVVESGGGGGARGRDGEHKRYIEC